MILQQLQELWKLNSMKMHFENRGSLKQYRVKRYLFMIEELQGYEVGSLGYFEDVTKDAA